MNDIATLTVVEAEQLAECEAKIERGIQTFIETGQALATVRDNRLYRAQFGTFEEYGERRWNLSRTRAYELMSAASIVSAIADTELPTPANEGQARALSRIPESERVEVWRETLDRTDGKPTAAAVAATWQERREPEPEPDAIDDIPLPFDEPAAEPTPILPAPDPEQERANAEFRAAVQASAERQQQELLEVMAKQEAVNAFGRANDGLLDALSYAAAFRPSADVPMERIENFISRAERVLEIAYTWKEQPE